MEVCILSSSESVDDIILIGVGVALRGVRSDTWSAVQNIGRDVLRDTHSLEGIPLYSG